MNKYQMEIAKLESRTPLFYYPYKIEVNKDSMHAMESFAMYFRDPGPIRAIEKQNYELVNEENMKMFSGRREFHYIDPEETEATRLSYVKQHAIERLAHLGPPECVGMNPNIKSFREPLKPDIDFKVIIGDRVDVEPPKTISFEDIKDLALERKNNEQESAN